MRKVYTMHSNPLPNLMIVMRFYKQNMEILLSLLLVFWLNWTELNFNTSSGSVYISSGLVQFSLLKINTGSGSVQFSSVYKNKIKFRFRFILNMFGLVQSNIINFIKKIFLIIIKISKK